MEGGRAAGYEVPPLEGEIPERFSVEPGRRCVASESVKIISEDRRHAFDLSYSVRGVYHSCFENDGLNYLVEGEAY